MKHLLTRLLVTFLIFLTPLTIANAKARTAPVCNGKSILEEERKKDPVAFQKAVSKAEKTKNAKHVFWRIEKPGTSKVSWLFGTMHVSDSRVNSLPAVTTNAVTSANTIALELTDIDNPQNQRKALFRNLYLTVLKPGQNLWTLLGRKKADVVRSALKARGIASGMFAGMQPYMVAMMLALPKCELARKRAGLPVLDMALLKLARKSGKKLVALESMKEQLQAFSSMPLKDQIDFLMESVKSSSRGQDMLETTIQLYLERKIALMNALMSLQSKSDIGEFFNRVLLQKRNVTMFKRSLPLVEKGGVFIAVGAMHLIGKDGLVEMYKAKGYKLVPIN